MIYFIILVGLLLILAGWWLRPKKPPCQSCQNFIACATLGTAAARLMRSGHWWKTSKDQMSIAEILTEKSRMSTKLKALRAQIKREAETVGVKSHSHNIISLALKEIAEEFSDNEANKAIADFKLEQLGWNYKTCDHCGHWPCGCGG